MSRQPRHGKHTAGQRHRKARAAAGRKPPDMQGVSRRASQHLGVIAKGILRFGNAHRGVLQPQSGHPVQLLFRFRAVFHRSGAVNFMGNGFNFFPQGHGRGRQRGKMVRLLADCQHRRCQLQAAFAAFGKYFALRGANPQPAAFLLDQGQFLRPVIREAIDGHHHWHPILLQVFHMGGQVAKPRRHGRGIRGAAAFLIAAAIVAQRPHRHHQHRRRRGKPRGRALNIKEFFGAKITAEAGFRYGVIGQSKCQPGSPHRIAAMGNIGKRAAMHQTGSMLQSLHQVRAQGLPQQGCHGAFGLQITGKNRSTLHRIADENTSQPLPQVLQVFGQAQNSHHFAGHADLEPIQTGGAIGLAAQADFNFSQRAVIHIHAAAEHNALGIQLQGIALMNVVIDEGRKEVIGRRNGMNIPGKVQINLLHGEHLCIAPAGSAALQAEYRAKRGFPQCDNGPFPQAAHGLCQPNGGGGFALSSRGGVHRSNQDQFPLGLALLLL